MICSGVPHHPATPEVVPPHLILRLIVGGREPAEMRRERADALGHLGLGIGDHDVEVGRPGDLIEVPTHRLAVGPEEVGLVDEIVDVEAEVAVVAVGGDDP